LAWAIPGGCIAQGSPSRQGQSNWRRRLQL